MIKITKDIIVFGFKIYNGSEIHPPSDVTNTGPGIITVFFKDGPKSISVPIICKNFNKLAIQFLDEICKLNTHESYWQYIDSENDRLFNSIC